MAAGPALAASAIAPVTLGPGWVVDDADALTPAEEQSADATLRALAQNEGVNLYVVIVDRTDSPANIRDWADAVATGNALGVDDLVLAIALDDGEYYISADSDAPVAQDTLLRIEGDIQPLLAAGDFAGAIDTAAAGMASGGQSGAAAADGGFSGILTVVLVLIVIAVLIVLAVVLLRRRRRAAAPAGAPAEVPLEDLRRAAASALVATDEAVRTSEQDLGFATAQFGDAATVDFARALATARQNLERAFTLQQQLDDEVPDTPEQTRAWNAQIVELCRAANADLEEKAAAFDQLRRLEADAPAAQERTRAASAAAAGALDAAAAAVQTLRSTYAPEAVATVDDNVDQARSRLAFAEEQLAAAQTALDGGDTGTAAVSIHAAEQAVGQASALEEAITALGADLARGEQQSHALIPELDADIRTAETLPDPDGRIAAAIAETRRRLDVARADLAGTSRRPLQTLQLLQEADRGIDAVVQQVRDAAARAQRAAQQLDATLSRAAAQLSAAEGFIAARRGAIGAEARTRVAEAGTALARAQQMRGSDPAAALQEAERADALASQAIQSARTDVGGFAPGGSGGGGDAFVGALLGGIVSGALFGGGSSRRSAGFGFGGGASRGRSSGFGGGFGGSRGRSGGGSFGSSRGRSGGGRF